MAGLIAFSLMAAQLGTAQAPAPAASVSSTPVSASARATVRILSGAKVRLSAQAEAEGYTLNDATITDVDGHLRPAKLVEFQ